MEPGFKYRPNANFGTLNIDDDLLPNWSRDRKNGKENWTDLSTGNHFPLDLTGISFDTNPTMTIRILPKGTIIGSNWFTSWPSASQLLI
jgi:hypothetical protein